MVHKTDAPQLILRSLLSKGKQNEYGEEHSANQQVYRKDVLHYKTGYG